MRVLILALLPLSAFAQCASTASTLKQPYVPPAPYPATHGGKPWYGSDALWTVPLDNLHVIHGKARISAKFVYWRVGWLQESQPFLSVVAKRLDAPAPLIWAEQANGVALGPTDRLENMAMMTGIAFTEAGCWEVSASYRGHTLSYVLNVRP
ncbi:MAG TPA: hypothetical protein VMT15_13395 [Bryobacteraceae bacterium]|nr:hypothetical protein [Bryobacteraceae bacterium]